MIDKFWLSVVNKTLIFVTKLQLMFSSQSQSINHSKKYYNRSQNLKFTKAMILLIIKLTA